LCEPGWGFLSFGRPYKTTGEDPLGRILWNTTKSREESLSAYLRKIKKDGIIDDATFHKILASGSSPGVLYGLPKLHKAGCPFRPIVSKLSFSCWT